MRLRTLLVLLLVVLYPSAAHAWWWDYFDGLSGPGPFSAAPGDMPYEVLFWLPCLNKALCNEPGARFILDDPSRTGKLYVAYRRVHLNNDKTKHMFDEDPADLRHVDLVTHDVSLMYRVNHVIDLGGGGEIMRFSGDAFAGFHRFGLTAKMTVTPFGSDPGPKDDHGNRIQPGHLWFYWLRRVPKFYGDMVFIPDGFKASDFGSTNPKVTYATSAELRIRAGFLIDLTSTYCAVAKCEAK
jgi:hypothetical protein